MRQSGIRNVFYGTQTDYRNDFKVKMGHINDKYFELFKKAVAFKPDVDLKRFITEFICETENQVDITCMRENIRHYERLKQEAEDVSSMVDHLEGIEAVYGDYVKEQQNEKLYGFLIRKGELEALKEDFGKLKSLLKYMEEKVQLDSVQLAGLEKKIGSCQMEINLKNSQLAEFEPYRIEQECSRDINVLKENIEELDADISKVLNRIGILCRQWLAVVETATVDEAVDMDCIVSGLRESLADCEVRGFRLDLNGLKASMEELKEHFDYLAGTLDVERRKTESEIRDVEAIRAQLDIGNKPYEESVQRLKSLLEAKLLEKQGGPVDVDVFCELIEIADERWKNAIEGYLHTQKFNIIVDPEHFEEAIHIFDSHKHELRLYGVGLVDVGRIVEKHSHCIAGSLAEEIRTDNRYAKAYADYILGRVMKCEDAVDLRNHRVAVTPGCMIYKNYVAAQIHPGRYEFPYIGGRAVKRQQELYGDKLRGLHDKLDALNRQLAPSLAFRKLPLLSVDAIADYGDARIKQEKILKNEESIERLRKTIADLDMSAILRFKDELAALEKEQERRRDSCSGLKADIKRNSETSTTIRNEQIPEMEKKIKEKQDDFDEEYGDEYRETTGDPRYKQEYSRLKAHEQIRDNFDQSFKTAQNRKKEARDRLIDARNRFETLYRRDLGLTADNNDKYDAMLKVLRETELPSFMGKIDEAIKKAQQEFKDDFVSKLKSNIDTVNRQIDALNASLKSVRFGKDRYQFWVGPSDYYKKYYDMITDDMLMNGYNLFSNDFQTRHRDALDELFKKIVDVGEGAISAAERAELEKNIEKYTDYRTYLDFDLIVTDENGEKSHLSKMLNKKSGGETQTPFFISVLASFHRLYALNDKRRDDTMRLIIFDEAFSKMDHERIEESLKLLREMRFQTLISAPTEKIANIAPYADKTLCVLRSKRATKIKEWNKMMVEG